MQMDPNRFWAMTLNEFLLALEGVQDGQDWMRYQLAWVVSNLLAPHIAKGHPVPSPRKLLGWPEVEAPADPAAMVAMATAFDALLAGKDPEAAPPTEMEAKFEALKQKLAAQGTPLV